MGKKVKERVISESEYLARLEQGVPVGDCWVDMGNGEYAYALQEVVVVARQFNKYRDKFLMTQTVSVLAAVDNACVNTQQRDAKIHAVEQQIAFERKKKETKERLYKITREHFGLKKAQSFPNRELLARIEANETLLLMGIANDDRALSVGAFPFDLYLKETELITEFVQIRSLTAKEIKPSDPGTIRRAPTEYEKWMMERRQLDPFAYQMGSRPEIQIIAVALLGGGSLSYLRAAGVFSVETNMTAAAIKGGTSAIGQAAAGGGVKDINVIGVASDAFLLPGLGAIGGNIVEVKPFDTQQPFRIVGYNKSFGEFGTQAVTSYSIGKLGDYGFSKFSPLDMKNKINGFVRKYHAPLIGSGVLILVCLIGYMSNYYPVNKYGIYTVGTVTDVRRTGGYVGPSCFFYFYYKGKRYEGRNGTELKKKDIGKRFYVQFLKENPNRCGLEDDKPVPDCIKEIPPEGWTEIPHCSYSDEKIVQALKEFYTVYISECDSPDGRIDSIRNKYLTKTLLTRLETHNLDYDPILQAQDCDRKTIQTLEIEAEQKNVYNVCYTSSHNYQKTCIRLLIVEWGGGYLIDDILSDINIH